MTQKAESSLFKLTWPLIISFWMRQLFTFVDTIYASVLGDEAIAAIGLAIPLEFIFIATWVGTSNSLTSHLSKAIGAKQPNLIAQYIRTARVIGWSLTGVLGVLSVAIYFVADHMGIKDPKVAEYFAIYGSVLLGGAAIFSFRTIIPDSMVKAHHDTKSTMMAGIYSNITNVGLNTLFMFAFGWGIFGIALSTGVARIAGWAYAQYRMRKLEKVRLAEWAKRDDLDTESKSTTPYKAIVGLSVLSALGYLLMASETALVNALLNASEAPTQSLAAFQIYYRFMIFALMPFIATSVAMLPYVARFYGEGNLDVVKSAQTKAIGVGAIYSMFIILPLYGWCAPWVMEHLSENALTIEFGTGGLRVAAFAALAAVPFFLSRPVFEGMQRGRPGLVISILRYVILAGPLGYVGMIIARRMGEPEFYGLIWGLITASFIASIVFWVWARLALIQTTKGNIHHPV